MTKFITIESWVISKRIQSNKPTKWQKLLAYLKLKPLNEPMFWWEAIIKVSSPHPLKVGDIILTRNLLQYHVMAKIKSSQFRVDTYKISSFEPTEIFDMDLGKTVILASACSEMDPNTQPYGGQLI